MANKKVQLVLESFGDRRLSKVVDADEVRGYRVDQLFGYMMSQPWTGEDAKTHAMIKRETSDSSGGFRFKAGYAEPGMPVRLTPVKPNESIQKYSMPSSGQTEVIRMAAIGNHTVGYASRN